MISLTSIFVKTLGADERPKGRAQNCADPNCEVEVLTVIWEDWNV